MGFKGFVAQSTVLLLGELRVPGQNWQRRVKEMSDKVVKASQSKTTRVGCMVGSCGQWESALRGLALRC